MIAEATQYPSLSMRQRQGTGLSFDRGEGSWFTALSQRQQPGLEDKLEPSVDLSTRSAYKLLDA